VRTVLVTGGAGYIGSHACKALSRAGWQPVTYDSLTTGWRDAVKFGPFVQGDLLDADTLARAFDEHRPEAVLHFAALSQIGESMNQPARYWRNNVLGTLNLVETMTAKGCANLVFSSTCAVYEDVDDLVTETSVIGPKSTYGATKYAAEGIVRAFTQAHGLNHLILRYFNVAGADPEGEIGEHHRPETHLIPVMLEAIDGKRPALSVFGQDYTTPDGTCIRDYVHVSDLVAAHVQGLERLFEKGTLGTLNLGSGKGFSVKEVIAEAKAGTNRDVPVVFGERRAGDARFLVSGSTQAQSVLGWRPERGDMKTMISDAWRWHQTGSYSQ
jgi:UDP-glucose 4-epimerase